MPQEGPKFAAQNLAEFALMTVTQLKVANAPAWWIFFSLSCAEFDQGQPLKGD